jgi:phage shock protein PspC (stress-responsive transcriptional regulator)
MNSPKVRLLLLISLLAALGALVSSLAAGSHFQIGFVNSSFDFDWKVATGDSDAATVLGLVELATGLVGVGLLFSTGSRAGSETGAVPGTAGSSGSPDLFGALRRLTKSKTDVWLGGVCGGLGEHSPLPSWLWRVVFLLLLFCYGTGVLLYLLLWLCLPEPATAAPKCSASSAAAVGAAE